MKTSLGTAVGTAQTGDAFARLGAAGAGLTALGDTRISNLDATVSSRMATYTQPTGFLAATFPTTVSSLTQAQVTGGAYALNSASFAFNSGLDFTTTQKAATLARVTLTDTATALTNAPTAGDFTATMKASLNAATPASTGSITGDVGGKVLGGGAGTITGTGVRAADGSGNAIAPASTALTTATWTNGRAILLDNLDATISSRTKPADTQEIGRAHV